jgi:hypothetical protein
MSLQVYLAFVATCSALAFLGSSDMARWRISAMGES